MDKNFEYYIEMARAAIPTKSSKKDYNFIIDYLEDLIDKKLDAEDTEDKTYFSIYAKSIFGKHGILPEEIEKYVIPGLQKRYKDFKVYAYEKFDADGAYSIALEKK